MNGMAEDLLAHARKLAPSRGVEDIGTAMALSFAATKCLFRLCQELGRPDQARSVVMSMNATNLAAINDMIAEAPPPIPRVQ